MIQEKERGLSLYDSGFTLLELIFFVCIAAILASVAVPVFSTLIPDYMLRSKAQELYADMHLARARAIKENSKYKIYFYPGTSESYSLKNVDGNIEKTVIVQSSDSDKIIGFGSGDATKSAKKSGGPPPDDGVSYADNIVTFNSRGTGSSGYVYLDNSKGASYAIGTLSSGVIFFKKWDSASSSWK